MLMKSVRLFLKSIGIAAILMFLSIHVSYSTPTYSCDLRNDYLTAANVYEFDVYLLNTTAGCAEEFQLSVVQFGINVPTTFRAGGTISVTLVPGTSELNASQRPTPAKFSFNNAKNCIIMTAMANPGVGNGSIISCNSPGTRVGRIRLTNTVNFGLTCPMILTWCFSATTCGYPTKVGAYVAGLTVDISSSGTFTTSWLHNPCINKPVTVYNVTGSGSYCDGVSGLPVGLDGSEVGVTYTMDPGSVVLTGTGSTLDFGIQPAGIYTVSATRNFTYISGAMNGAAVITNETTSVSISVGGNPVCIGSPATFTAIPVNGGTAPTYQWKVNATNAGTNSPTFIYTPANNDAVTCVLTSSSSCTGGSPATSNTVIVHTDALTLPGVVSGGSTIGFGMFTDTLTLTGNNGSVLGWQKRVDPGIFTDIPNTTGNQNHIEIPDIPGTWDYRVVVKNGTCPVNYSSYATVNVQPVSRTVNLKVYLQGLFNPATGNLRKAQDEYGDMFPGTIADKIWIQIAKPVYPYSVCNVIGNIDLNQDGTATFSVPRTGSYYIVVRHRNSLETWSAAPVNAIPDPVVYDFTTADTQAFGDNQRGVNGVWMLWGGDVNQDGIVDAEDMNLVDNAATAITFGYVNEDNNGDGLVDLNDMNIVGNNLTAVIMVIRP
jgi:hypothetical protein